MVSTKQISRRDVPAGISFSSNIHPVLQRIYASRGVCSEQDLQRTAAGLLPYQQMKGLNQAVTLLTGALEQQQRIVIVGDFDADGATSTVVLMNGLRSCGFRYLEYLVPNRFEYGYGLTPEMAELAVAQGAELIITVDNGISAIEGIALAKKAGVKVLVTDHHLPGAQLPDADAIVNPNQPGCNFPSKALAGVGVVFYLLLALRAALREQQYFQQQNIAEPNLADLLDLVALGTVADVVPLDTNNRILVHQGLMRIRSGKCRPGIQALMDVANRNPARLTASDFGFALAPRLNAAGRLDDMSLGISCLLATSVGQARQYAAELDKLNAERRAIEQSMQSEAQAYLSQLSFDGSQLPECLCLYRADWHQGVIGILAGRIKEQFHRPAIMFADGDNGELKGSARSIAGLHIRDLLEEISSQYPGLIKKFGGHAMAAGLTIDADRLETFKLALNLTAKKHLTPEQLTAVIYTDGELDSQCFDLQFAMQLQNAGPWGQAFPEPVFDGEFRLINQKMLADRHLKMMLQTAQGKFCDAIWFNADNKAWPDVNIEKVRLVYQLDINEYREQQSLQLIVRHMEAVV